MAPAVRNIFQKKGSDTPNTKKSSFYKTGPALTGL